MTAIFIAILDNKLPAKISSIVPPAALAAGLPHSSLPALSKAVSSGSAAAIASIPGMTTSIEHAVRNSLSDAYSASYAYIYYSVLSVGCVAIISALVMRDYDDKLTGHVPKQIYRGQKDRDFVDVDVDAEGFKPEVHHFEKRG
jgi:hypothetical protein